MDKIRTGTEEKIRTDIVELNIGSSITTAYTFGQLPTLSRAKKIISIEAYDVTQVSLSRNGKNVITNAVLKKSFIELVEAGGNDSVMATLPLVDISKQNAASVIEHQNFPAIDWQKSKVTLFDATGLTANESFLFKIKYVKG